MKRIEESERDPFRKKRVKKLLRKVMKVREKSMKDKMLLLFTLEKEIDEDRVKERNKYDKLTA